MYKYIFLCIIHKKVRLDPQGWEKGVVFINGLNLGRYWSIGPQQALYLPGPFLNSGINQVSTNLHKAALARGIVSGKSACFLAGLELEVESAPMSVD